MLLWHICDTMAGTEERSQVTRDNQRARTRRDLVAAALRLVERGHTPTVTEVADAAQISRRTAYRYFPNAEQLMVEALLEGMRSDVEREIDADAADDDMPKRVDRLVDALHHLTVDKDPRVFHRGILIGARQGRSTGQSARLLRRRKLGSRRDHFGGCNSLLSQPFAVSVFNGSGRSHSK